MENEIRQFVNQCPTCQRLIYLLKNVRKEKSRGKNEETGEEIVDSNVNDSDGIAVTWYYNE